VLDRLVAGAPELFVFATSREVRRSAVQTKIALHEFHLVKVRPPAPA
jgi:hypothetical protein